MLVYLLALALVGFYLYPAHGLVCLQCNDILQPRHCHTVVNCNANEACFTSRSLVSQRYQLGCRKRSICTNSSTSISTKTCDECCSGSLCNTGGCGEPGYPAPRGPICYDCDYHNDQRPCTNIDNCSVDEECSIQGKSEFGDKVLISGCKLRHICQAESAGPSTIIGKRSIQTARSISKMLCNACCKHDLCNLNCSSDPCFKSPCQHGTCSSDGSSFRCHCRSGWSGSTCNQTDYCASSPCVKGICVNEPQGFLCQCPNGTFGRRCQTIDHCLSSPCIHGSCINNQSYFICNCSRGWTGTLCETAIIGFDCLDILHRGLSHTDGVYSVRLNNTGEIFKVYCDMSSDGGGWTVFQKRFNGSVDFYRNFSDCDNGFGSVYGEFWLGLKYIHQMTVGVVNELRLDLGKSTGETAYEVYQNFSISGYPNYTLHIGNYSGTAGDGGEGLSYHDGQFFSTYDKDQGKYHSIENCAVSYHGSWWYRYCAYVNLNGKYITPGTINANGSTLAGMVYYKWTNDFSLKSTEMKFRRK